MKTKVLSAALCLLALTAVAQLRPPTCDPSNPSCTLGNGCSGGPCNPGSVSFRYAPRSIYNWHR